jgi:hypothetical protein
MALYDETTVPASRQQMGRSAVSNGTATFLPESASTLRKARRYRDVLAELVSDLGGNGRLSEAQRQLCRRAATSSNIGMQGPLLAIQLIGIFTAGPLAIYARYLRFLASSARRVTSTPVRSALMKSTDMSKRRRLFQTNISPTAAMSHKHLFGPYFRGPSWDTWRAVLRAAFAESMNR